jgi:tetratricopeptide (TPR) repeat protein
MTRDGLTDFDSLWDYEHPEASERAFRDLLPAAEAAGDATYTAELLTQIARAQGLQGHFEEAHRTLAQAAQRLNAAGPRAHIRYLLERGRVFNSSGDRAQARPAFLDAWDLAREHGELAYAIDAAHMLGIVEPLDRQVEWSRRALDLAEASDDPAAQRWRGPLYNNLGWTYFDTGRYNDALDMLRRDARFRHDTGQIREARIARWAVGRTLRALERYDEARMVQEALLAELENGGHEDGYVYEELGELLLAAGDADGARPYFAKAHALLSKDAWLVTHEAPRLDRLRALGATT